MLKFLPSILFLLSSIFLQSQTNEKGFSFSETLQIEEDTIPPIIFGHPFVLLKGESLEDVMINFNPDEAIFSMFPYLQEIDVVIGTEYIDIGAEVFDESQLTNSPPMLQIEGLEAIDTSMPTSSSQPYEIKYIATDAAGNRTELSRYVNVIGADLEAPIILLVEDNPLNPTDDDVYMFVEAEIGGIWEEPGFYAYDNVEGLLTDEVFIGGDEIDLEWFGDYRIIYTVDDAFGNTTTVMREIEVKDTTPPVVSFTGILVDSIECLSDYHPLEATAYDEFDGDLTNQIEVKYIDEFGIELYALCICRAGDYIEQYTVSDCKGNIGIAERLITVYGNCDGYCYYSPEDCMIGSAENSLQSKVSLYPNPTKNHFFIDLSELQHLQSQAKIEVYNTMGELAYSLQSLPTNESLVRIDLTNQQAGIYFVQIQTLEGSLTKKVMLNR